MGARRWTAIVGLASTLPFLAGLGVSPQPGGGEPDAAFAAWYADERTALMVMAYGGVLGTALVMAFLAGLREVVADTPRGRSLGTVALVTGAVGWVMPLAGFCILGTAAYRTPGPEEARMLTDLAAVAFNLGAGGPTAVSVAAFTLALYAGPLRRAWVAALGALVTVAHLAVGTAFAREGFFAPEGAITLVVPGLYGLWIVALSVTLLRAARTR